MSIDNNSYHYYALLYMSCHNSYSIQGTDKSVSEDSNTGESHAAKPSKTQRIFFVGDVHDEFEQEQRTVIRNEILRSYKV